MFKDKKNVIILLLSIIIFLLVIGFIICFVITKPKDKPSIDASKLSNVELLEMFNQEGYKIEMTNIDGTLYLMLKNKKEGITIQRIPNTLVGTLMTFGDDSINDEMADIITLSSNDTKEKEQQYKAFKSWLEYYNVSKTRISEMLDDYYGDNKDEVEYIDTEELLKSFK